MDTVDGVTVRQDISPPRDGTRKGTPGEIPRGARRAGDNCPELPFRIRRGCRSVRVALAHVASGAPAWLRTTRLGFRWN